MVGQLSVWSPGNVTLLTNGRNWTRGGESKDGGGGFNAAQLHLFEKNGTKIVQNPISEITQDSTTQDIKVVFADRNQSSFHSLHLRPTITQSASSSILSNLNPALRGPFIQTDTMGKTNIKGLYAAGDCMEPKAQVALAIASGMNAAFGVAGELGLEDWNAGVGGGKL